MAHVPSKLRKKIEWLFRRAEGGLLPKEILANEGNHLDPDGAMMALVASRDDVTIVGDVERLDSLQAYDGTDEARAYHRGRWGICGVHEHRVDTPGEWIGIYRLEIETFPRHVNNVYVVTAVHEGAPFRLLLDAGSGLPSSQRDLALAFAILRSEYVEHLRWEDLDWCLVSHGHIDHFGGVNTLRKTSRAKLAVHELDAPVITHFEERLGATTKDLDAFWARAGVPAELRSLLRDMYGAEKQLFRSESVDRILRDGDVIGPGFVVHHVPGHCPGLVCLRVRDVLLTSDHVLARITPHQFPKAIAAYGGLAHYLDSLQKIRALSGIRLALGGHEEPIADLGKRIDEIAAFHRERLDRVRSICAEPRTIYEVATAMFGERQGYDVILAVDEAGAHLEVLHARGEIAIDEVEAEGGPIVRYVAPSGA